MYRSKGQLLIDNAEDDWTNKELCLDMSNLGARYVSSRIYDLSKLYSLNLENNKLRRISDQIGYLSK